MNPQLLQLLSPITPEEQQLLQGGDIRRELYMQQDDIIRADKLMDGGLITYRPHTRFAPFPAHRHDYVELFYMCQGESTHIINGVQLTVRQGELLLLPQHTIQQTLAAQAEDIGINFIVLPAFFEQVLSMMGEQDTPLRRFLVDCLCARQGDIPYLHFRVADQLPIQNLVENLLYTFIRPTTRQVQQTTMGLLFLHLLEQTQHLAPAEGKHALLIEVYRYIEQHYRDSSLEELADKLHFDIAFLSRRIKQLSGHTFTELLQQKRLSRAAFLLKNTNRRVEDIARDVGYENITYFHRLFRARFHLSPRHYRIGKTK